MQRMTPLTCPRLLVRMFAPYVMRARRIFSSCSSSLVCSCRIAASKAGLVQLTKQMAVELARHGIRVNALCPGYIETPINRDFFASEAGQAVVKRVPQRRLGQPADLTGPLLLLASPAGAHMTGAALVVVGGHSVNPL